MFSELVNMCRKAQTLSLHTVDITKPGGSGSVNVQSVPTIVYFDEEGNPTKMQAHSREERTLPKLAAFLVENHLRDHYKKQHLLQQLRDLE